MKKYLITGYSGFVSRHFLNLLESFNVPVEVLGVDINDPEENADYTFVQCSFQKINLLNRNAVHKVISDFRPDYLLHLASYSSVAYSWKNPVESFVNNTNIFLNLADVVRLLNIPCRILSVGSSEEYGNIDEADLPVTEEAATKPKSPYAVARVSQEMLSEIYAKSFGVDIVLTRSFNHIGPGQKDIFVISSFAKKLTDIKKDQTASKQITVGNISLVRDFVDVRDVVKAYYLLFQKGRKGEAYNICSGKGSSLEELLHSLTEILNLDITFVQDPALIRPDENKIVIGSYKKIEAETGWRPLFSLKQSLGDIVADRMERS